MSNKIKYLLIAVVAAFVIAFGLTLVLPEQYSQHVVYVVGVLVIVLGYQIVMKNKK